MYRKKLPSIDRLNELFSYNEDSGCLIRKVKINQTNVGDAVTRICTKGYVCLKIDSISYQAHRVIWKLVYGEVDECLSIDHIDRDKTNNRLSNLRLVTDIENSLNRSISKSNSSGTVGVHYDKTNKVWVSKISVDGKRIFICRTKDKNHAISERKKAEKIYGYHKNHGVEI